MLRPQYPHHEVTKFTKTTRRIFYTQVLRTCSWSRCGTGFLRFFENRIGSYIDVREKRKRRNTVKSQRQSRDYEQVLRALNTSYRKVIAFARSWKNSKIIILFDGIQTKNYWVENQEELLEDGIEITTVKGIEFYKKYINQRKMLTADCATENCCNDEPVCVVNKCFYSKKSGDHSSYDN